MSVSDSPTPNPITAEIGRAHELIATALDMIDGIAAALEPKSAGMNIRSLVKVTRQHVEQIEVALAACEQERDEFKRRSVLSGWDEVDRLKAEIATLRQHFTKSQQQAQAMRESAFLAGYRAHCPRGDGRQYEFTSPFPDVEHERAVEQRVFKQWEEIQPTDRDRDPKLSL